MSQEKREVKSTLSIELPAASLKALEELGKQIQEVGRKADQMHKSVAGSKGGGKSGGPDWSGITGSSGKGKDKAEPSGFGSGNLSKVMGDPVMASFMKDIAAVAAKVAIPVAIATQITRAATAAAKASQDPYTTSGQAGRAFVRDYVPFGGTGQGVYDVLHSRAARMGGADIGGNDPYAKKEAGAPERFTGGIVGKMRTAAELERNAYQGGFNVAQAGKEERNKQLKGSAPILMPNYDRSTLGGEIAFKNAQRLLPIDREIAKAVREQNVATQERVVAERELSKAKGVQAGYQQSLAKSQADADRLHKKGESGPKLQFALRQVEADSEALAKSFDNRRTAEERVAEAKSRESQAKGETRFRRAERLQAESEIAQEKLGRAETSASALGGMDPFEQNFALQAAQKLKSGVRPDQLHPEELAAAQRIAPDAVGKIVQTAGANSGAYSRLQEIFPDQAGGKLDTLRADVVAKSNAAATERMGGEKDIAAGAAEAGRSMGEIVGQVIMAIQKAFEAKVYADLRLAKNSP